MQTTGTRWSTRRTSAHATEAERGFALESLEQRALLTADFGVEFDNFDVPAILVPGDRFIAGVVLTNNGPMTATGAVTIQFYLSQDVTLSADDVRTNSYPNQPLPNNPPVAVGEELFFSDEFTIPRDIEPGSYFLLARIIPNAQVGDNNQSNNVVASVDAFPVEIRFGTIPGRTGAAILELLDPEGTVVQFRLAGGGQGTVARNDDGRFDVNVTGSGANSQLTIATSGGDGVADIDDINIAGSLAGVFAGNARLLGSLAISGTLGELTLGNVGGTAAEVAITIGQAGVETDITLGAVTNASISTPGGLGRVMVTSWTDTTGSPTDMIEAQWIDELASTGAFGASLVLSGRTGAATLGSADIGGALTGGSWRVIGRGGAIQAFASTVRWSASFTQLLGSFTTDRTFRGRLAAKTIQSVTIGLDLVGARILGGADLGADGRLGGSGEDADQFRAGNINALTVAGRVRNSIVGAGLNPVNGVLNDGDDRIQNPAKSKLGPVTIGGTMAPAARIVGGRFTGAVFVNGIARNPSTDARFMIRDLVGPSAAVLDADTTVVPSTIRVRFRDNVGVLRSSIGAGDIRIDAPDGLFSLTVEVVSISRPGNGTPMVVTYSFTPPGGAWDPAENGTYTVVLLAGAVTDVAGNPAGGGSAVVIGTFTVAV